MIKEYEPSTEQMLNLLVKVVIVTVTLIVVVFGACAGLLFNADAEQRSGALESNRCVGIKIENYVRENSNDHDKIEDMIYDLDQKISVEMKLFRVEQKEYNENVIRLLERTDGG